MTRIYLVGAQSAGKTTLANRISQHYRIPLINEVATTLLAERRGKLRELRTNLDAVADFQREVFHRQIVAEQQAGPNFVSDRSFDNLAYAAEHTTILPELMNDMFRTYVGSVKSGVTFFLRPEKQMAENDSLRTDADWESVVRIDGMIKLLLEQMEVDYIPIRTPLFQERWRTVKSVMKLLPLIGAVGD